MFQPLIHSQLLAMLGLDLFKEPGTPSRYPMWATRVQVLGPSLATSQGARCQEAGSEVEVGLEPGTLVGDAGIPRSLKCGSKAYPQSALPIT